MMDLHLWLAFVATYTVISIIPGPSVLMVTGLALARGTKAAFWCIVGDLLAGVVLIALSLFGVGAILATSAALFQGVKWAGVLYMAYLGYSQIRHAKHAGPTDLAARVAHSSIRSGFLTGVLNPKAIAFYMAFLAQFLNSQENIWPQFLILVPTATLIVGVVLSGYVLVAVRAQRVFTSRRAMQRFGYAGGGFLLGGSVLLAVRG